MRPPSKKENVGQFWNFQAGDCEFQDRCWFNHKEKATNSFEFKCGYCDKYFSIDLDFSNIRSYNTKKMVQSVQDMLMVHAGMVM